MILTYSTGNPASRSAMPRAFIKHGLRSAPDFSGTCMCYFSRRNEEDLDAAFSIRYGDTRISTLMAAELVSHEELTGNHARLRTLLGSPISKG